MLEFRPIDNDDIGKIIQFLNKYSDSNGREWIRTSYGEFSIDYDVRSCDLENGKLFFEAISVHRMDSADMLCALHRLHKMTPVDDLINNGLIISGAKIPRTTQLTIKGDDPHVSIDIPAWISFSEKRIISFSDLIITHKELEIFLSGGKDIPYDKEEKKDNNSNVNSKMRSDFIRFLLGTNKFISNEALKNNISINRLLTLLKEAEDKAREEAANSQHLQRFFDDTEYKTPNYKTLSK